MKRLIFLGFLLMSVNAGCVVAGNDADIPLSIQEITSTRVADGLIRVVLFNTEVDPKMYIELIKAPGRKLLQRRVVKSIELNKEVLDFESSGSVFIENIKVHDNRVDFEVIYEYEGRGGEITAQCHVESKNKILSEPVCKRVME